jgi:hypothetical protein
MTQPLTEAEIFARIWDPTHPEFLGYAPTIEQLAAVVPNYPVESQRRINNPVYKADYQGDDTVTEMPDPNGTGHLRVARVQDAPSTAQRLFLLRLAYERGASDQTLAVARDKAVSELATRDEVSLLIDALTAFPEVRKTFARSKDLNDLPWGEAVEELERRLKAKVEEQAKPEPETFTSDIEVEGGPVDGRYTVVLADGNRRTLFITTAKRGNLAGKRIIKFLSGSDNVSDYTGFGFVDGTRVTMWKRFRDDSILTEAVRVLMNDPKAAAGAYALESGNCYVCGRTLTTPESIEAGIGPKCEAGGFGF